VAGVGVLAGCSNASGQRSPSTSPILSGSPSVAPTPGGSPSADPTARTPSPASPTGTPPSVSPTPSTPPASTPTVALPSVRPWAPGAGEIEPAVKRLAVAAVIKLLKPAGTRTAVEVIDAQYGGILSTSASVLVPCRVYTLTAGRVLTSGTTVDVRLTKSSGGWRVTATHPAQPGKATTRLTTTARQVLANSNISLPPASAADIRSGQVHDSVLTTMLELARTYRIGISVIRSGHPIDVFGTDRPSDHPRGRAFDTWQINGHAVVNPATSRALITSYMRAAESFGSYNVGGPYQLSGAAYFSDRTHHDHVHAGFRT
jgi:hypothetical protein